MATVFTYNLIVTVNDMVAIDQMRQQIADSSITVSLVAQSSGVLVDFTTVTFTFESDLSNPEVTTLTGLTAAHDGAGLFQLGTLEVVAVVPLLAIAYATQGWMAFVPDEAGGPVPAYYDGTNWRRVTDGTIVS